MRSPSRIARGQLSKEGLPVYLLAMTVAFWGLIYLSWRYYPEEHYFSVMTHFFSLLGAFDDNQNPGGWWWFSAAIIAWGFFMIPLSFYAYRRFCFISKKGAALGLFFFLASCAGLLLVGIFPQANVPIFGDLHFGTVHILCALFCGGAFGLAVLWHGLLLLFHHVFGEKQRSSPYFNLRRLFWPFALWMAVFFSMTYHLVKRDIMYTQLRKAIAVGEAPYVNYLKAFQETRFSFFLWENIMIFAHFIFLIWFFFILPRELPPARD